MPSRPCSPRFFGGLALGSFLAGRWIDRVKRPLRWYGFAEMAVGGLALVTTIELRGVRRLYVAIAEFVPGSTALLVAIRLVLSVAVLIAPATLLGATLPLISASTVVRGPRAGERIGLLYATNTAGAIMGCLAAGFWLIGSVGIRNSFQLAAAMNLIIGVIAIACSSQWERDVTAFDARHANVETTARADLLSDPARQLLLAVFAMSGFVAIALEVVWFRVLVLYVESDTYTFTIILAAVLVGIALGAYVAAAVMHRWGTRLAHLAVLEVAIALAAVTSFRLLSTSFAVDERFGGPLGVFGERVRFVIVVGALAVAPTALLFGVAFPIGLSLWASHADAHIVASRVGSFYAVNVAAGIAGSLAAGFVLLPAFGARTTLLVLCIAALAAALGLCWVRPSSSRQRSAACAAAAVTFATAAALALPDPYASALIHRHPGDRVLWQDEGAQTTASIHEQADGTRVLYLDGLPQASDLAEQVAYHGLIGALPLAVHPHPQRALVVGLGGGVTTGVVSEDRQLDVDVVELSPEAVEGASWLAAVNGNVTSRANVSISIDDGRNYLLRNDEQFDIITADVIQPHHVGAGKVWSVEYWKLTRDALAPGGVMVQWVPNVRSRDHSMIVRSFLDVFPYVTAWANGTLLVGSNEPLKIDVAAFERRLAEPGAGTALRSAGIGTVEQLRAMYTAGRRLIRYVGDGPILTDDRPRLEFWRSGSSGRDVPPDLTAFMGDPVNVIIE